MRQTPATQRQTTDYRAPINVVGGSTFGRYNKISSEITYNMFVSDDWLINFAGYKRIENLLGEGTGRGIFRSIRGNVVIVVVGSTVISLDETLSPTIIGSIGTSSGEVFMDENLSNQICIVDGVNAYIYNYSLPPNLTLQSSLSGVGLIPKYVKYHNTYFLFGNNNFSNSGAAWYAFSFDNDTHIKFTTELALQTKPDFALAVVRIPGQGNNVLVLGSTVSEIWTQVGGLQNYRRNSTSNIDYGCISVSTIAESDQFVCWLAVNENNAPVIMVFGGGAVSPISTDGIDYLLSKIEFPGQSTAMFYRQDGHLFYQLTFYNPKDNMTLVYDFNTKMFFNLTDQKFNYHPARNFVYFNNKTYFISLNNGALYESSTDYVTYNENIGSLKDPALISDIERIRVCAPTRNADSRRFAANLLTLTIEQGCDPNVTQLAIDSYDNPLITESVFDPPESPIITEWGDVIVDQTSWRGAPIRNNPPYRPRVDTSISIDGGITWSNYVGRYLNPIGQRKNQLTWNKLGVANDLTLKFKFWGASRFVINNAVLEMWW